MDLNKLNDNEILEMFGAKLRTLRLAANVTQEDFAQKSDISVFTISQAENGHNISMHTVIKGLRALGYLHLLDEILEPHLDRQNARKHVTFHHTHNESTKNV